MPTRAALLLAWILAPAVLAGQTVPPARSFAAAAWDASRHRLVLYGGLGLADEPLEDTWEWDGRAWTLVEGGGNPGARIMAGMAHDPRSGKVLLFGGVGEFGALDDTWLWDGRAWIRVEGDGPPARVGFTLALDAGRRLVLLMGGQSDDGILEDTWEWDGTRWRQTGGPVLAARPPDSDRSPLARAYEAATKSDLRNLVTAMEAFFADHNRYAATMDELTKDGFFVTSTGVTVTLVDPQANSYGATGTHAQMPEARCSIWVGSRPAGIPESVEGTPVCEGFR